MLLHRAVVFGEYLCGFRILGHRFGHQCQQRTGVGPVAIVTPQVDADKALERIHAGAPLGRFDLHQGHETAIDETRQRPQQPGLVAKVVGGQAAAVTRLLADLGQGHADPALARDNLPCRHQQPLLGLATTLCLGAARRGLGGFSSGFHWPTPYSAVLTHL
ncbi:hypothetical protein D9M71_301400 [compost metagenome]